MRLALLSDIHANREGLEAVLADLDRQKVDRIVILGDIVGQGPDPDWCLDTVEHLVKQGALCLRGNHDRSTTTPEGRLNPAARRIVDWTVNRLNARQRLFLDDLPYEIRLNDALFVHASADHPETWRAVTEAGQAAPSFAATDARLIFCGHVHRAALYSSEGAAQVSTHAIATDLPLPLLPSRRWMGVLGSVGQPRDGMPLAAYAILDDACSELTFKQVPFDAKATLSKSRAVGLPLVSQQFLTASV
jgi:predicted phosphodiesterase